MKTFIDLSHTVTDGMLTYKGLPPVQIDTFLSRETSKNNYEGDTSFYIGKIAFVANTGTYIDTPFHRYEDGSDLVDISLTDVADIEGITIDIPGETKAIRVAHLKNAEIKGKAVLLRTGWDRHWLKEEYYGNHPFVTREAAEYLRDEGAAIVGIDSYNIDDINDGTRPAHSILLAAGIYIVEHMTGLDELPEGGYSFFAVPVKVRDFGSFPVRAFAIIAQ